MYKSVDIYLIFWVFSLALKCQNSKSYLKKFKLGGLRTHTISWEIQHNVWRDMSSRQLAFSEALCTTCTALRENKSDFFCLNNWNSNELIFRMPTWSNPVCVLIPAAIFRPLRQVKLNAKGKPELREAASFWANTI